MAQGEEDNRKHTHLPSDKGLEEQSLAAFRTLFAEVERADELTEEHMRHEHDRSAYMPVSLSAPFRILHFDAIRKHCIRYRLRFLHLSLFRSELPFEAIRKVRRIEEQMGQPLRGLMLIAGAGVFQLKDKNKDPMLLARLEDGRYALIHEWGKKPGFFRRVLVWPLRSFRHSLFTIVSTAFLTAFVFVPDSLILGPKDEHSFALRVVFFFYLLLALGGLSTLYGFSKVKSFNAEIWNRPYTD